jgi:CBS domain-containing protein
LHQSLRWISQQGSLLRGLKANSEVTLKENQMKKCREVMTANPSTAMPTDTAQSVAQLMQKEDIGLVPVVDNAQTQKLMGVVTDRDLALKVVAQGQDAKQTRVEAVMTRQLFTCQPEDDLQKALDAMGQHQVRRVPVVNQQGALVGIIAQADVATRGGKPAQTGEVVKEISQPD